MIDGKSVNTCVYETFSGCVELLTVCYVQL